MRTWILALVIVAGAMVLGSGCDGNKGDDGASEGDQAGAPTPNARLEPPVNLADVRYWAYQIQGLEKEGAIESLASSRYDLVVIDPTRTNAGSEDFDTREAVNLIHASPSSLGGRSKLVLAYLDIGEAEDYRTYWQNDWEPPRAGVRGTPDFLVSVDPDGWSGNYPVAYWDPRWKDLVIYNEDSLLNLVLEDGFGGVYLDWVEAFDDVSVIAAAELAGIEPAGEMVAFITEMRDYATERHPNFLIVVQNGADLVVDHPEYLDVIDGLAQEDLSFYGEADTDWDDAASGDIRQNPGYHEYLTGVLGRYVEAGVPTFCVQYAQEQANVEQALRDAEQVGCVPYVTLTPLDRLTDTPPYDR